MALIRVRGAALIGLVLLFEVNFVDSIFFCNKCTSTENGESCGNEVKDAGQCKDDGEYNHCMTYQYTFNDSTVTVRDCPDANYNCKTLYADGKNDSLLMCNQCNDDVYCNENIDTTSNTCAKCNSLDSQDCGDTIGHVGENTCFLDSTVNTECVVYKYKGAKGDSSPVTVRDCGRKNTCDSLRAGEYKETLEMCYECSNTNGNNCNQDIPVSKTCVKCNSLDQPGCERATIDTGDITGTCYLDDTVNTECITYKYKDNATTTVTVRDCAPKNTCKSFLSDTYKQKLVMCHECSDTPNCNQNLDDLPTCVECNSSQDAKCNQSKIDTSSTTGVCYLDSIVNFECITYQYLEEDSLMVSVRGCAPDKNCEALHSDTYKEALLMCDECSDGNNCNEVFDTTKTCIECNSLNNGDCQESSPDLSTTCFLDQTVNTECITYKFNNENNQTVTIKGCAPTNQCTNLLSSEKSSLLMCDACNNSEGINNCNQEIDTKRTCIECNSEDNHNCKEERIDPSITNTTCYLDETVNSECVTYKYQKDSETSVVVRGCAPNNSCATLGAKNELLYCYHCSDEPNCNEHIDTSTTCVKCNSDSTDSDCGDTVAKIKTCFLDKTINSECITYKYQNDNNTQVTIRDCAPKDYCETLHNDSLIMCNHCTGNNCNSKIDTSKKCVQCNSIDDPECAEDRVDTSTVHGRCYLDDTVNVQCVSYKYLQDGKTYIYRGCGSEKFCDHASSNTMACASCIDDKKICNVNNNFEKECTLCIQCTSEDDEECEKDDMNSSKIKNYCPLDADNSECVAYKYLDILNGTIQTKRDCATTNYCDALNANTNTTVCEEGTSLIFNKKIDTRNESILCVECTGEEGSSCAAEEVDLSEVGLCKITNKDGKGCFVYKHLNSSTDKMITERGCDASGYCINQNLKYTAICSECEGVICNKKVNETSKNVFCVECDGEEGTECGNEIINDLSQVGFCVLDSTSKLCVAYRYLNVTSGKIHTHRGCESEDYCKKSDNNTTITCNSCKENDHYCNKDIEKKDEKTLCVQCDDEADASECSKDDVDLAKVDFCGIASTEKQECVAYRYLNVKTNKLSTHRGCEPKGYCDKHASNTTILCFECEDDNCNKANDPTDDVTLCVQCNSEHESDECTEDASDLNKVGFCKIYSPNGKCVAYRHLDVTSGSINTYRGCEDENYCNQQNNGTKIICSECNDDNNCNMEIEKDKEITLCVSCDGETCASDSVDLKQVEFCGLDSSDTNRCATHRYFDVTSGKINTHRGCESKNYCTPYNNNETTLLCDECRTDDELCNRNIKNEDTLCVECSGEEGSECAADTITKFSQVNFCKINSSNKRQCVAHRYLNVTSDKIITYRGCELDNYCNNQSDNNQIAMICSNCTSTGDNVCNVKIDTSIEKTKCIQCTGEEGTDCANNTIHDLTNVELCTLADNQQCVTYKYLDDKTNTINIKRGCETTNYCDTHKNEDNTLICDECHDEICNIITKNEGKFICVQCSGEEDSECANNTVNLTEVNSCIINSADNEQCVSHKYLNVSTGKINIQRGCVAKDYCKQQNKVNNGTTALCHECNDSDQCNMNIDTSEELTLCIECVGEEGSDCAAATVDLAKMSFCGINATSAKECISYRYLEESRLRTVRGCETRNCSTLVVDDRKVQQCSECHEDICNNYLEIITTTTVPPTTTTSGTPTTTTSGAASIVQYKFNVIFLYLIIGLLFLVH